MLERLIGFSEALRSAGVPVSVSEDLDALRALKYVDLSDRTAFKRTLATTMIKKIDHVPTFDALFNICFDGSGPPEIDALRDEQTEEQSVEEFMSELIAAIASGSGDVQALAERAVTLFGRVESSPSDSLYFEYPVTRALDADELRRRLAMVAENEPDPLEARVARARFEEALTRFRAAVRAEVQQRVARRRGPEVVTRTAVRPLPEDLDLATASKEELDRLRKAIRPLARKLAARTAMRRRMATRGAMDIRRTVRHSLSTGGVPFDVAKRHKPPRKPELFVLCDVSSSVARYARFSLMLVHALSSQFSKVRSFVFIDTIDEVTGIFEKEDFVTAIERVEREANVVWIDGHSNYGAALDRFVSSYGHDLSQRSTVLLLGDARNNFRAPRSEALAQIQSKAKHVFWLNPEPQPYWDSGDSAASTYAVNTDGMFEVRTLRNLENFVEGVLT